MKPPFFAGQTVVVTGVGKRGQVGAAVARTLAECGASLVLLGRKSNELSDRASELVDLGASVSVHTCDLTDEVAVERVLDEISEFESEEVAGLVCVAGGFAKSGRLDESDPAVWHQMMSVNLTTAYLTTRAFLPLLRKGRGAIVYFSSASALAGARTAGTAAYAASKSGVIALMQSVAQREKRAGVRANALAPVSIRTGDNVAAMGADAEYVELESVAAWVAHLASDSARDVTGQVIRLG